MKNPVGQALRKKYSYYGNDAVVMARLGIAPLKN